MEVNAAGADQRPASRQELDMSFVAHQRLQQKHSSPSSSLLSNSSATTTTATTNSPSASKNKKLFPQKLWDLINDPKYNFCLRWSDDGQLVYLNRDEFEDSYLKTSANQFHTQKAISFVRQMNMYGFRKVDDCYYENDNFRRDCEHLLKNMIRKHSNKSPSSSIGHTNGGLGGHQSPVRFYRAASHGSFLQSTTAAVAVSLLAQRQQRQPSLANADYARANQAGLNYLSIFGRPDPLGAPEANQQRNINLFADSSNNRPHQPQACQEEDTLTSEDNYCCSAGSSQAEGLTAALERSDSDSKGQVDFNDSSNKKSNSTTIADQPPKFSSIIEQQQQLALFPQLCSSILDSFQLAQADSAGIQRAAKAPGASNSPDAAAAASQNPPQNQAHLDQHLINLSSLNNFVMDLRAANTDSKSLDEQHSSFPLGDQKELFKVLQQQQSNTQLPKDLSTNLTRNQTQLEQGNNLSAFYALLSSINGNLYQQQSLLQETNSNYENATFDVNNFSNLQQTCQNMLLSQQQDPNRSGDQSFSGSLVENASNSLQQTGSQEHQQLISHIFHDKPNAPFNSSLLVRKTAGIAHKVDKISTVFVHNQRDNNNCQISDRSHAKHGAPTKTNLSESEFAQARRRDTKFGRMFKRSADSILDSNNNGNLERSPDFSNKRIKLDSDSEEQIGERSVNEDAKNLVLQVVLSRDTRVDTNVIREASRFTERFVETLFDTAQVIARHSNGSSSTDAMLTNDSFSSEDKDLTKNDKEIGRSNINLSDLTSALKLLPSKLLKILK